MHYVKQGSDRKQEHQLTGHPYYSSEISLQSMSQSIETIDGKYRMKKPISEVKSHLWQLCPTSSCVRAHLSTSSTPGAREAPQLPKLSAYEWVNHNCRALNHRAETSVGFHFLDTTVSVSKRKWQHSLNQSKKQVFTSQKHRLRLNSDEAAVRPVRLKKDSHPCRSRLEKVI